MSDLQKESMYDVTFDFSDEGELLKVDMKRAMSGDHNYLREILGEDFNEPGSEQGGILKSADKKITPGRNMKKKLAAIEVKVKEGVVPIGAQKEGRQMGKKK